MSYQAIPFFPHRRHKDGTIQSICLKCLATVAISRDESELTELDKAHFCSAIEEHGRIALERDRPRNSGVPNCNEVLNC
jgi:hypothetical protein